MCDLFLSERSTVELRAVSGRLRAASGRLRMAFSRTGVRDRVSVRFNSGELTCF